MMKYILIICQFVILLSNSRAQRGGTMQSLLTIRTYPLSLVYLQEFNIAFEKVFNEKNGFEFLVGTSLRDHVYYTPVSVNLYNYDWNVDGYHSSKNALIRIGYRRYLKRKNYRSYRTFISPRLTLKYSVLKNAFYEDLYDGVYQAYLDIERRMLAFNVLIGKQSPRIYKSFIVEWYVGLGLRYSLYHKTITESHWTNTAGDTEHSYEARGDGYYVVMPNIFVGISIGLFVE